MNASDERLYNEVARRIALHESPGERLHRTIVRALEGPTVSYGTSGVGIPIMSVRKWRQQARLLAALEVAT